MPIRHLTQIFFSLPNPQQFYAGLQLAIGALHKGANVFAGDNLITFGKNLSFFEDERFMKAVRAHVTTGVESGIIWRMATLAWAARRAMALEGDLVECACYKGTTARIVADYVDLANAPDRTYYLYDLFEHDPSMPHHHMPEHSAQLYAQVKARFSDLPNVVVTSGRVPDVLSTVSPQKIALLHLDLNNADAEIGALEILFDRIVPGGLLVLDDFGWQAYAEQNVRERAWLTARGYSVLELPTGQGLVIK